MPGGFGSRFALEAGFLILLAVVAGLAHLRPLLIVAVMSGAWALVSLIEWLAWRAGPRAFVSISPAPVEQPAERAPPAPADDEDILVPEAELEPAEPEPLTTMLPPADPEPGPEPGQE